MIRPTPIAQGPVTPETREHKAAKELEGIFLRQLLQAAKLGGAKASSTHAGMAVDALAQGLTDAGGLGLRAVIERALSSPTASPHAHATAATSAPPPNETKP